MSRKVSPVIAADAMSDDERKQLESMREEPIADPEPAPEPAPPEKEAKKEPEKQTMVPHEAMEAERQRRKTAERKAQEMELNQARLDERLNLLNEAMTKKAPVKEAPDPDKDALGAVKITIDEVNELKKFRETYENNQRQAAQIQEIGNKAANMEREFITSTPDYNEATTFLKQSRFNELQAFGLTPEQAQQELIKETLSIAIQALNTGKNPAEIAYKLAMTRGYTKKQVEAVKQAETDSEKLANIAAGQKANLSLGDVSGSPPNSKKIDGKTLATMSEAQFAKVLKSMSESDMQELMGN